MNGRILRFNKSLSLLDRIYISIFGVPISGLRIRLRRILPYTQDREGKLLDAGCGRGAFCFEIAQRNRNIQIVGVDIDPKAVEQNNQIANSAELHNLKFEEGNIEDLSFLEEFDTAISVDNLEHLQNDLLGIISLYQALKPGGKLILHVPGYYRLWFFSGFRENFDVPGHFRPGYLLEDITQKLTQAGFVIDKCQYTYGRIETLTNNISYCITKAEAKNKLIYAIMFPALNFLSWFGRNSSPRKGAGVLVIAYKPKKTS